MVQRAITEEYFQFNIWWTPNQIRDSFFDFTDNLETGFFKFIRNLALAEQARRKTLPEQFVECPYCKGYHGQRGNIDNLCEVHEAQLAPLRYDKKEKFVLVFES